MDPRIRIHPKMAWNPEHWVQHYLGKLVLTEVHVPQVDQALQATRYVVQGALRVPDQRSKF
jgi:hypothetical protein